MSYRSELIFQELRRALERPGAGGVLVTVRATSVTRINLSVLRVLLTERGERGIFLSLDRPDRHMLELLERHNLAAPGEASSSQETRPKKIVVAAGVISPVEFLDEVLARLSDRERAPALEEDLRSFQFIMVDNLSSMALYSGPRNLERFFRGMEELLLRFPNLRCVFVTARGAPPEVMALARRVCPVEVDIKDEWLI
ncbi:MAG: hypothetical protein QW379_01600 [Thermoplasmata archaeon]